jgi:hypothetical protein
MSMHGGTITYTQQADLPNYGVVWFNEESIANIISMSKAERRGHSMSYLPGCLKLTNIENGLMMDLRMTQAVFYAFEVPINRTGLVQTITENEQFFTSRQIEMVKQARNLYEMIGQPSYNDFISIIKNNMLPHTNITIKGVMHAETTFGKELGSLQGKTVRKSPKAVITDDIEILLDVLEIHHDITLAADIMNVDGNQFLITTSRNIQFTTVEKLDTKETLSLIKEIVKVINLYKRRGMRVQTCLVDNEFECIRHSFMEMGVYLNVCAPHEHVPEIERKIRTVKERIRGTITMLPFQIIPTIMITHAVIFPTMWLNFPPPKGGVPQAIVTGLSAIAERHCRIPFV